MFNSIKISHLWRFKPSLDANTRSVIDSATKSVAEVCRLFHCANSVWARHLFPAARHAIQGQPESVRSPSGGLRLRVSEDFQSFRPGCGLQLCQDAWLRGKSPSGSMCPTIGVPASFHCHSTRLVLGACTEGTRRPCHPRAAAAATKSQQGGRRCSTSRMTIRPTPTGASVSDDTSCGWSSCPTGVAEDQVGSAL